MSTPPDATAAPTATATPDSPSPALELERLRRQRVLAQCKAEAATLEGVLAAIKRGSPEQLRAYGSLLEGLAALHVARDGG